MATPFATGGRAQQRSPHGPRIRRFNQSQVGLEPDDARLVSIRTEALFGPNSGGFVALLDNAVPVPIGGGGIDPQARHQRRPLTPYHSPDAMGIVVSFILDGYAYGESVEKECRVVERMAGMFVPDDSGPQRLIVQGKAVPHCSGAEAFRHRWLISETPSWGDDPPVSRREDGDRTRQQISLTLFVAEESEQIERVKPRQPKPASRVIHAHKGDTYEKIAARELDTKRLGRRLAKLNGKRDPTTRLDEGQKVTLPSSTALAEWKRDLQKGS
jgi:hypothetical protein